MPVARRTSIVIHVALAIFMLLALVTPQQALAQGSVTGKVNGTITDSSGAVIPEATAELRNVQTNDRRTTATSKVGTYEFLNIPIGEYELTVKKAGFSVARAVLTVTIQSTSVFNFALTVGSATEVVTVSSEATTLNTVDATLGGVVSNEKVTELPLNGRSFVDLVGLQP